ncbi:hypothetical protein LUPAC06_06220 [Micromonospora saelicesensis]|uniref:hypothetical protein n=1 Tax=Micromonospora saelicesensis TaxID=285676 RepID=UPI000DBFDB43|nr:hypothetical protein [Micromonospora saelicesensis]RAO51535.1 hypothetical protein LUPAC06_06220 [Micromonospora saelicesensis]
MTQSYLVVLGHRDAIGWVLREERMAFPSTPRAEVAALRADDRLFLYATRGAWLNPTRDRSRIIGLAYARSTVRRFDEPLEIAGRAFVSGCDLTIEGLVPYPGGLELQPLVEQLDAFPKPQAWGIYLRRALLQLSDADADDLLARLTPNLVSRRDALGTYPWATSALTPPAGS